MRIFDRIEPVFRGGARLAHEAGARFEEIAVQLEASHQGAVHSEEDGLGHARRYFFLSSFFSTRSARFLSVSSSLDLGMSSVWRERSFSRGRRSASFLPRSSASLPSGLASPAIAKLA